MESIAALKKAKTLRDIKGRPAEALQVLTKIASSVRDPYEKILLETQMAHYALDVGRIQRSKTHFESAIAAVDLARVDIVRKYVYLLWKLGERKKALRLLEDAEYKLRAVKGAGADLHFVLANIYATRGNFWFDSKRYRRAIPAYRRALREAEIAKNFGRQATILGDIGNVYWAMGRYDDAIATLKRALRLARKFHRHAEPSALLRLGRAYSGKGRAKTARRYFFESLRVARRGGWRREIADACRELGMLDAGNGKAKNALRMLRAAERIYRELGFLVHVKTIARALRRTGVAKAAKID